MVEAYAVTKMVVWGRAGAVLTVALHVASVGIAEAQSADRASWTERPMGIGRMQAMEAAPGRTAGTSTSPADKCAKWRRIADRLGETYAGVRLRRTVVARVCAFADEAPRDDQIWAWPWGGSGSGSGSGQELDGELPPRLHATFAAWSIRCGPVDGNFRSRASGDPATDRERCALISEAVAEVPAAVATGRIVTHFVIDHIGGEDRVLWRVYVERAEPHWFDAASTGRSDAASDPVFQARAGTLAVQKSFDGCGRAGCLLEADVAVGGRIAARLADGAGIEIDVRPAPGVLVTRAVAAEGFRAGWRELARLRRSERRLLAGR
jgi:hypothetical protein